MMDCSVTMLVTYDFLHIMRLNDLVIKLLYEIKI